MFIVINTYIKMANSSDEKKITWGSPFSWKGPQFHIKLGTLGSPKYYEIGDGGPRFHMKLGTWGPHFGGSPFSYDTGTGTQDLVLGVPATILYSYRSQPPKGAGIYSYTNSHY